MNIKQLIQRFPEEYFLAGFWNRYGGKEFIFGFFRNAKEYDRLFFAANIEEEQFQFAVTALRPGVLPYVHCDSMAEGEKALEEILAKINDNNCEEWFALLDKMPSVFLIGENIGQYENFNVNTYHELTFEISNFKEKWKW